jgi:DNA-binding transcriptional LysR family regulator
MTFHQLHIFIAAATTLNLRQASEQLRIAQPAISRHLRSLQEEFQSKFHTKIGTGIALTRAGELFLREAKAIVSRAEKLSSILASAAKTAPAASLDVGGGYSPSAVLLPSVLARFQETHPDVQLSLRTDDRRGIMRLLLDGHVHLAVLHDPPPNRFLTMEPYREESLIAFVAYSHPLARKRRLSVEDFRQVGFIIRKPAVGLRTGKEYLEALRRHGFTTHVVMRCDSPEAVKMAVRRKMGVGILYNDAIADDTSKGEFKRLSLPADIAHGKTFILYHRTRPLSPPAMEFLALLRSYRDKY